MTLHIPGMLEVDCERGVIYFHTSDFRDAERHGSITVLRVCSLPRPIPVDKQLDITHLYGTSWDGAVVRLIQSTNQSQEGTSDKK